MMEFFNNNKNAIFGFIAATIVVIGIVHWSDFSDDQSQNTEVEVAIDNLADKKVQEIIVVSEESDFAEKVNEAAIANQVNAAQKLSDDTDGPSEE